MADVTNYTIENASGANVRIDLNNVLAAIQSNNSKSTDLATSQCVAGMPFLNTTTNILKIRNSANNGFTEIGNINVANLGLLPAAGGTMTGQLLGDDGSNAAAPAYSFDTDADTGLFRVTANTIGISSAGSQISQFDASALTLLNQLDLRFREATANGTHYVGFQAPSAIASSLVWTLPNADTTVAGYALVSDGSGNLSWAAASGGATGGGNDQIFWENSQTITTNYSITNGKNAGSFGPITIASGVTVTVGSGETWTVV